jgi:hypothetical protein
MQSGSSRQEAAFSPKPREATSDRSRAMKVSLPGLEFFAISCACIIVRFFARDGNGIRLGVMLSCFFVLCVFIGSEMMRKEKKMGNGSFCVCVLCWGRRRGKLALSHILRA